MEGLVAGTTTPDRERIRFRPWAFPMLSGDPLPPLMYRHSDETAGYLETLEYDNKGQLLARAEFLTRPEAKRCTGLSVAARVLAYEIRHADSPDLFEGLITRAEIR